MRAAYSRDIVLRATTSGIWDDMLTEKKRVAGGLKEVFIQAMVGRGRYDQGCSRRLYQESNSVMAPTGRMSTSNPYIQVKRSER